MVTRRSVAATASAASASQRSWASMNESSSRFSSALGLGGGPVAAVRRQVAAHRLPGPLERTVGRGHAGLEQPGGVGRRQPEHLARQQRRPLPRRQHLQRGEERQLDRLAGDVGLVRLVGVGRHLVEHGVGVRRQPAHLGAGRDPALPGPRAVEADVRGDPVQPGPGVVAVEGVARAPGPEEGLLHGVLGVVVRREHAVAVHVQLAPVPLEGRLERVRASSSISGRGA